MRNRISSLLLCLVLLLSIVLPANAEETAEAQMMQYTISDTNSFLAFAEKCRLDSFSENLRVVLRADIDLTGVDFQGIPIFSGTFEGGGHTIRGLSITTEGSDLGLFRYLTDTAVVQDLNVTGTVQPGGSRSRVGGIAGNNAGKILHCSFSGTVSGKEYAGGISGTNAVSGIIENCTVSGHVSGGHFAGGMAGESSGVIRGCENTAAINETAVENTLELTDITLDSLTNSEAANTVTDIGGIAGSSIGVIRACVNRGTVGYRHMGYNIGGIAGTQSGALLDCENYGAIQGRKEVGGIVGQLEPTALIQYEEDALQILQRQLNNMGSVVSDTVTNVRSSGDRIITQVGQLQDHVQNAQDAVDSLIPDRENPELPDADTIQAAKNTISTSISGMTDTLQGMSSTAYSSVGALSTNLHSLQNQINAMRSTLGNVSQTLGGSITDVSDTDTELDLTGKVADCVNYGTILADRNAGGIAGAIAMENDLDYERDWTIAGDNSLNFESELRAVVLGCVNEAEVTCKKQNAGGIVGLQSMGLVKDCQNSGRLNAEAADYVGGISGQSQGFLRKNSAKCEILGTSYVGGIAGSATIVSDCRSMVKLGSGTEFLGAILGSAEEPRLDAEDPISGNLYFSVEKDLGGIDGISYAGQAEPVTREAFLALEELPQMFRSVTVRFRYPNGMERAFAVPLGDDLAADWVPPIPPKNGYQAYWEGLTEDALTGVLFDMTFEPAYTGTTTALESDALREEFPVMLLQGVFGENAKLAMLPSETDVPLANGEKLLEVWEFTVKGVESIAAARLRLPKDCDAKTAKLLLQGSGGDWREAEFTADGSYLVFTPEAGDTALALIRQPSYTVLIAAGLTGALVVLVGLLAVRYRKKHPKTK